jgi:O-succinylbenzoic acid--CoA ligase
MQQGTVAVPVNTRWPAAVTGKVLAGLNCRHLYVSDEFAGTAELIRLKVIRIAELAAAGPLPAHPSPDGIPLDNTCDVMFTSGSTGEAKAALHLLQNHYYSALGSNENIHLKAGDRWMISLPLFHAGGLAIVFRCLLSGAAMVLPDEGLSLAENAEKYQVTHFSLVGTQFHRMLHQTIPPGIKAVLLGGGPLGKSMITEGFSRGLPIFVSYGSTEMSSQITTSTQNAPLEELFTAGRLLPHRELMIAEDGEILVCGETLFAGYLRQGRLDPARSSGWFRTGDIGELLPNGNLSVLGRKDNMFISGGENIHPEEIERVLMDVPGVAAATVVDIPDQEYGARPCAFIDTAGTLQADEIRAFLAERIARFKIPAHYIFRKPDGKSLKAGRHGLRDYAINWLKRSSG